jgi:hypothetical protein
MDIDIDWTKPVEIFAGGEWMPFTVSAVYGFFVCGRAPIHSTLGPYSLAIWKFRNTPAEPPEPEIDWGGELQALRLDGQWAGWADVTIVWHDEEHAIGWASSDTSHDVSSWPFAEWKFRNKPPEPEPTRIQGWINIYNSDPDIHATRHDAIDMSGAGLLACIYIDVAEGQGIDS